MALSVGLGLAQVALATGSPAAEVTPAAATASAGTVAVPADPRLDPVRGSLQRRVDRAAAAGQPVDLLVKKIREGLAKGVDPSRIDATVGKLAESVDAAHAFVAERRAGPPPPALVRAVAEARMTGVELAALDALVRKGGDERQTRRAVEVMTDLSHRGYPADRAAAVVSGVLARDPASLDRVPGTLETIRADNALTAADAVDALARGLSATSSLQGAYTRAVENETRKGTGRPREKATSDTRDGPGKSSLAPGQLPKVMKPDMGKMKKMK